MKRTSRPARTQRALWAFVAALLVVGLPVALAAPPKPFLVIAASTANPAVSGAIPMGSALGITCTVRVDANVHAVTVHTRTTEPDGTATDWVEWTTAAGSAGAGAPYVFVIPLYLPEIRISVANAGADTVNASCVRWGGGL